MKFCSALTLSLLLAACGQAGDPGSRSDETPAAVKPDAPHAAGLTAAYLAGPWCHTHNIMGDEQSDEMLSYIFSQDGTLLYQTNSTTNIEEPGSYTIDGKNIKIKPTLASFNMELESMSQDAFILKMAYGKIYWSRGACKPPAQ